jgi:tetratricopeptide (TPR) repeat protein
VPLNLEGVIADRYLYLPMIGLSCLFAHAACWVLERWGAAAWSLAGAAVLGGLLLVPSTVARVVELRTGESAWKHEIQVHPDSIGSYRNLANALLDEHRRGDALIVRREAIAKAKAEGDRLEAVVAWVDDFMGTVADGDEPTLIQISNFYADVGDPTQVHIRVDIADLHEVLAPPSRARQQLRSTARFRNNAAVAHARAMDFARAELELEALSESQPTRGVLYNLGRAQALQAEWDRAQASFERAHALDPSADAQSPWPQWIERGRAISRISDPVEREVARAQLLIALGSPRAALAAIDQARRNAPQNEQLVETQVHLDGRLGRWEEARSVLTEASRADAGQSERWMALSEWVEQHDPGSRGKTPEVERRPESPLPAPP